MHAFTLVRARAAGRSCYISSSCQGACSSTQVCSDESGLLESCYGVGNTAGWNKYQCISYVSSGCYISSSCSGQCGSGYTCQDKSITDCLTAGTGYNYKCIATAVATQTLTGSNGAYPDAPTISRARRREP